MRDTRTDDLVILSLASVVVALMLVEFCFIRPDHRHSAVDAGDADAGTMLWLTETPITAEHLRTFVAVEVSGRFPLIGTADQAWLLWVDQIGGVKLDGSCWTTSPHVVEPQPCDQLMRRWAAWNSTIGPVPVPY